MLFLIDSNAAPLTNGQVGLPLPSWFFPLTNDKAMAAHVAKLTADELDGWEKQVAGSALKGSQRAADLLLSRRK